MKFNLLAVLNEEFKLVIAISSFIMFLIVVFFIYKYLIRIFKKKLIDFRKIRWFCS